MGLVAEERLGRTKVLRTTPNFADYFNLSHDLAVMKNQLEKLFQSINREKDSKKATHEAKVLTQEEKPAIQAQ
jgi:chromosome segregation and condensation protein ScpB